jgi:hypothetical protein
MSNKYEQILERQSGNGFNIEEGFQKLLLKEIEWINPKFNDVAITITVSPVEYPQLEIQKIIGASWNTEQKDQKSTIWKVLHVFSLVDRKTDIDIDPTELFDTSVKPPEFLQERLKDVNKSFDQVEVYGYLFQARKKNKESNKYYWNVHYNLSSSIESKDLIEDSYKQWKANDKVRNFYEFKGEEDSDISFRFGKNKQKQQTAEAVGF